MFKEKENKSIKISVRITPEERQLLENFLKDKNMTMSKFFREAGNEYIKKMLKKENTRK